MNKQKKPCNHRNWFHIADKPKKNEKTLLNQKNNFIKVEKIS